MQLEATGCAKKKTRGDRHGGQQWWAPRGVLLLFSGTNQRRGEMPELLYSHEAVRVGELMKVPTCVSYLVREKEI